MKLFIQILFVLVPLFQMEAHAAKWKCFQDSNACPGAGQVRCVGYGWCGPTCDVCKSQVQNSARTLFDSNSRSFSIEATERYAPWTDYDRCSRAVASVLKQADQYCSPHRARQISDFKEKFNSIGAMSCTAAASFICQ